MAETLTVNNDPDSEVLSSEEQESLQLGEQMQSEQEQLLAGKYKNAEELEQAYVELQKKLGDNTQEEQATQETETEETTEPQLYKEDGSVNYESVNKDYGEKLGTLFKENNVDPYSIADHFYKNNGEITEEMHNQLTGAGIAKETVDAYLSGRAKEMGYNSDISQTDIDSIQNSVGGEASYKSLMDWAYNNLSKDTVDSFDELIVSGNKNSIQLAVNGLVAQYQNANGYEGRMLTGKPAKTNTDVFQSQAQLVEAMNDPRYDKDPAYRQNIMTKLDRSNMEF
tara:strand:+ start:342 stop:1187 length:846 start_codon:yes stop_codon:yes gene_type:complete